MFTQSSDDTFLDGPAAGPADRDAHLVMAAEAVQLVLEKQRVWSKQQNEWFMVSWTIASIVVSDIRAVVVVKW